MKRPAKWLFFAVFFTLSGAAQAAYEPLLPVEAGVMRGLVAARAHWQADPPCPVEVFYVARPNSRAVATATTVLGDGYCRNWIEINVPQWDRIWLRARCNALVHEWGHLLGRDHDSAGDVMYEHGGQVRECERGGWAKGRLLDVQHVARQPN